MMRSRRRNRWPKVGIPTAVGAGIGTAGLIVEQRTAGVRDAVSQLADKLPDIARQAAGAGSTLTSSSNAAVSERQSARNDTSN